MLLHHTLSLFLLTGTLLSASAQTVTVDPTFNPGDSAGAGRGSNGLVRALAVRPDGKVLLGGSFGSYNGKSFANIAQLLPDGQPDPGFAVGSGFASPNMNTTGTPVHTLLLLPSGKVLAGGAFTLYQGAPQRALALLNPDGSADAAFTPAIFNTGTSATNVYATALQPDGKILVGGFFAGFDGRTQRNIARLHPDGRLDTTFRPVLNFSPFISSEVTGIAVQPDGHILISGAFDSVESRPYGRLARLAPDGRLDTGFRSPAFAQSSFTSVRVLADGKVLLTGKYGNDPLYNGLLRLHPDGRLDSSLAAASALQLNSTVSAVLPLPDGSFLVGGTLYNGYNYGWVLKRLLADGSYDPLYAVPEALGGGGRVTSVAQRADGKVIIVGAFTEVQGRKTSNVAALDANGSFDLGFNAATGTDGGIYDIVVQPDGKILFCGLFARYNGAPVRHLARVLPDGTRDPGFLDNVGADRAVYGLSLQPDGKILASGAFTTYHGVTTPGVARLNPDGSYDAGFRVQLPVDSLAASRAVALPDGRILVLVGPGHTSSRGRLLRLLPDGRYDSSFVHLVQGSGVGVNDVHVQPDGRIVVVGSFSHIDGVYRPNIVRLNADGTVDQTFAPGIGTDGEILRIIPAPDNRYILVGRFSHYGAFGNQSVHVGIARISRDGVIDNSFNAQLQNSGQAHGAALQPDGKIVLVGSFSGVNGATSRNIARLNADGSTDNSFQVGTGLADLYTPAVALQADGKVLVGGFFTSFNGTPRNRIARLLDGSTTTALPSITRDLDIALSPNPTRGLLRLTAPARLGVLQARIVNLQGQVLRRGIRFTGTGTLDLGGLPPGTYVIETLRERGGERISRSVLKL